MTKHNLRQHLFWKTLVLLLCTQACTTKAYRADAPQTITDPATDQPNIVLVLFEDMSPRVGAYGDPLARTPNFNRIAAEGVRYTRAFTSSGVCAPSRAALITGRYQQTIGAQHMRTSGPMGFPSGGPQNYLAVPPTDVRAFPEVLRANGYHTSNDSKTDYQFGDPFTIWDQSTDGADWTTRQEGQPFFHMRSLMVSHESYIWPVDMPTTTRFETLVVARNQAEIGDRPAVTNPASVIVPPYLPDTPEVRRDIATHYDNIASADAQLGEIYDRLDRDGLLESTILIVSTDHGDGLPRMKRSLYDSGIHVPLVIRYPGKTGTGTIDDDLVSFVDLAPTILSLAGIDPPAWLQGQVFAGDAASAPRDYVYAAQDRMDNEPNWRRAVRDTRYKYIRNQLPGDPYFEPLPFRDAQPSMKALWAGHASGALPLEAAALFEPLPEDQLYDTRLDPHEVRNLARDPDHAETLARMQAALDAWIQNVGDMSVEPEIEMIKTLWPEGVQPQTDPPIMEIVTRSSDAVRIRLTSPTPGASIGFRAANSDAPWSLYSGPITLAHGEAIETKAIRYGYAESDAALIHIE